jgi:hypothetical protein
MLTDDVSSTHADGGAATPGANPRLAMFNAAGDLFWLDDDGVVVTSV